MNVLEPNDQILSLKCVKHPKIHCDILNIDPHTNQHRVCAACMKEQKIPFEQVVFISELLSLDSTSKFSLYPIELDENLEKQINGELCFESILGRIKQYFAYLQNNLISAIGTMLEQEQKRIYDIILSYQRTQSLLKQAVSIKKLQEILLSNNSDKDLHEYIVDHCSESKKRIENLKKIFDEIQASQKQFSTSKPDQIAKKIISLIQEIDFFSQSNRNLFQPLLNPYLNQQQQSFIIKKWDNSMLQCSPSMSYYNSKKEFIIEMQENNQLVIKSNAWSAKFCYLKTQLNNDSKYIIRLDFNNIYNNRPDFMFMLFQSENKDNGNYGCCYNEDTGGHSIKIVKGRFLNSGSKIKKIGQKNLEFRIDIKNQYWRVSSFPKYTNVVELNDSSQINPNSKYHFGVYIGSPQDYVRIQEIIEVSEFDTKM